MKKNPNYILRNIAGDAVLISTGKAAQNFNGMMTLNETAAFVWDHLDDAGSRERLVELVLENYDVDPEEARRDVFGLVGAMVSLGIVEDR